MKNKHEKITLKVVVACSTGGHMIQARQFESIYSKYDFCYFTFQGGVAEELAKTQPVIVIPNITKKNVWSWIRGMFCSLYWAIRIQPDVVFTTGAGVVVFFCVFCKLFGSKLIFLESMARVESPTLTARMLHPFANLFLVQWPALVRNFSKAQYWGRLF